MITTVTLNPMLDKTMHVDSLARGQIHRAVKLEMVAGGKGINVARQLKCLGVSVLATGFLGGEVGSIVGGLLRKEGLGHDFVDSGAMTREGVTYLEPNGTSTAVFEPAGRVAVTRVRALKKRITKLVRKSAWIVCSGSSPCPEADDVYHEAILSANKAGIKSVLDSYGRAFKRGLEAVPTMIKPNRQEYEKTFGKELRSEKEVRRVMENWLSAGIKFIVLTDGAKPAYAASSGGQWKLQAPSITTVNPVGSGDAMVAGIVFGLQKGWEFERCLEFGIAAGAANARKWPVANSTHEEIEDLRKQVTVKKLK